MNKPPIMGVYSFYQDSETGETFRHHVMTVERAYPWTKFRPMGVKI